MKKSLGALTVLGATLGAARAQSTVTLNGRIDMSVMHNHVFGRSASSRSIPAPFPAVFAPGFGAALIRPAACRNAGVQQRWSQRQMPG